MRSSSMLKRARACRARGVPAKWSALLLSLGLSLGLAACDSPSEPLRQSGPKQVAAHAGGEAQTAGPGEPVPVAPAVRVTDASGRPLEGVKVAWVVTRGGGGVASAHVAWGGSAAGSAALAMSAEVVTDGDGIASAAEWRLGDEGENELQARVTGLAPVVFAAIAVAPAVVKPPPPGPGPADPPAAAGYAIDVRVIGSMTVRQRQALDAAVARWQQVITGDAPDVSLDVAAGSCFPGQPALRALVDDLVLYVEFVKIDGAAGVLGEAGPCFVRKASGLPVVGYLKLDAADLARMEQSGTLDDVVLHEIGHVLGIGTMWADRALLVGEGGPDPRFTGAQAVQAYRAMGGLRADVAVENTGEVGTRDSHWRESEFRNELMTGWVGLHPNPLSAMTIASLQDLGYGASTLTASQYTLGTTFGAASLASEATPHGRDRVRRPLFRVDRSGRHERM